LRSIGDAVIAADRDGVVAFLNPAAERLIGRSPEQVVGRNLEEVARIIDQESSPLTRNILSRVMTESTTVTSVGSTYFLSGKEVEIPVDYSASPLIDDHETIVGIVLIVKDLTSQRMMEIESTMREMAMASSINALCVTDLSGRIRYANDAFYRLWGFTLEEVTGGLVQELCRVEDELSMVIASLKEKGGWTGEMAATKKDGTNFALRLEANRIDDKFGRSISNMYSFLDITELKKAREELKKYMVKLDRTDKKTEEITENLSDEVAKAHDSIERLFALSSAGTFDLKDKETAELLSEVRGSIGKIATLKDQLVESTLPLSLYIYLAELSRMKIEDFR
jgi:PAS domain S-box-containing protein